MSADAGRLLALLSIPEVSTTYWGIEQLQPMQLSQWLEREGVNSHGNILELRGRLLRLFVRRSHPEAKVPWYPEDDSASVQITGPQKLLPTPVERPKELTLPISNTIDKKDSTNTEIVKNIESKMKGSPEDIFEYRLNCIKILRLWNKKIKFSGQKGQAAREFVDDIKDFQKYTKINDQMLLDIMSCVMHGPAKAWYRSIKQNSWTGFEIAFLKTFIYLPDPQMNH